MVTISSISSLLRNSTMMVEQTRELSIFSIGARLPPRRSHHSPRSPTPWVGSPFHSTPKHFLDLGLESRTWTAAGLLISPLAALVFRLQAAIMAPSLCFKTLSSTSVKPRMVAVLVSAQIPLVRSLVLSSSTSVQPQTVVVPALVSVRILRVRTLASAMLDSLGLGFWADVRMSTNVPQVTPDVMLKRLVTIGLAGRLAVCAILATRVLLRVLIATT
mmetsp:Transcript_10990/g.23267  ORF Transcript_10990/g.23267 Transcript_10990/m.23267 type:complete len:217 (+) Transcript_10990:1034-1684(+)